MRSGFRAQCAVCTEIACTASNPRVLKPPASQPKRSPLPEGALDAGQPMGRLQSHALPAIFKSGNGIKSKAQPIAGTFAVVGIVYRRLYEHAFGFNVVKRRTMTRSSLYPCLDAVSANSIVKALDKVDRCSRPSSVSEGRVQRGDKRVWPASDYWRTARMVSERYLTGGNELSIAEGNCYC